MSSKSKPASVTVVKPTAKQSSCALSNACCFSISLNSGIAAFILSAALSTSTPVGLPFLRTTSPPSVFVFASIPASSSAKSFAITACPSMRVSTTALSGNA